MAVLIRSAAVNKYNLFFSSCMLLFRIKKFYVTLLIFIGYFEIFQYFAKYFILY